MLDKFVKIVKVVCLLWAASVHCDSTHLEGLKTNQKEKRPISEPPKDWFCDCENQMTVYPSSDSSPTLYLLQSPNNSTWAMTMEPKGSLHFDFSQRKNKTTIATFSPDGTLNLQGTFVSSNIQTNQVQSTILKTGKLIVDESAKINGTIQATEGHFFPLFLLWFIFFLVDVGFLKTKDATIDNSVMIEGNLTANAIQSNTQVSSPLLYATSGICLGNDCLSRFKLFACHPKNPQIVCNGQTQVELDCVLPSTSCFGSITQLGMFYNLFGFALNVGLTPSISIDCDGSIGPNIQVTVQFLCW